MPGGARVEPKRLEAAHEHVTPRRKLAKKKTKTKTKSTGTETKSKGTTGTGTKPRKGSAQESHLSDTSWDEDELCLSTDEATSAHTNIKLKHNASSYLCCRLCAHSFNPRLVIDIFDPSLDLATLIASLLYIPISIKDRKPLQVCQKCAIRLEKFAQFARVVQASDTYFTACLAKGTTFQGLRRLPTASRDSGQHSRRDHQSTEPSSSNLSSTRTEPRVGLKLRVKLASNGTPSQIVNHTSQKPSHHSQESNKDSPKSSQVKSGQSSQLENSSHSDKLRPVPKLIACIKTEVEQPVKQQPKDKESCVLSGESVQDYFSLVPGTPHRQESTPEKSSSSIQRTKSSTGKAVPNNPSLTQETPEQSSVQNNSDSPQGSPSTPKSSVPNYSSDQASSSILRKLVSSGQNSVPNYSASSQTTPPQESVPNTPTLDSGSQSVPESPAPDESDYDSDPGALCIVDIKEEPLDIDVDEIKQEEEEEEEDDAMFETHHEYNMDAGVTLARYLS
ncbi:hypothetical protein WDU94_006848 [Cyamophila willieti]